MIAGETGQQDNQGKQSGPVYQVNNGWGYRRIALELKCGTLM